MISRSGRVIKKPEIYTPDEKVEDDYGDHEYDTEDEGSDIETDDEYDSDEESEYDGDEDADENGNLKDFVVDDDEEEA
jgi:hypothetical protein